MYTDLLRLFSMLLSLSFAALSNAMAEPRTASLRWETFEIPGFGTRLEYPAGIFVPSGPAEKGTGQTFDSPDGRAVLSIYSSENRTGETPATYLRGNLRVGSSLLDYERVTTSFFAVSMERNGLIYYSRCNFSLVPGNAIHCFDLVYPQDEKRAWDPVVTRMSLSLRPRGG
jgi:hypothetical protein